MSKAAQFARDTGLNLLGQLVLAAASFFLTPYLVRRMGIETYGLYILLYAFAGYLSLFSFGAGTAAIKYTAQFHEARDRRGLRDILLYSGATHLLGALLGAALVAGGAGFLAARVFRVPDALAAAAVWTLRAAAAGAVFAALAQFAGSALQGLRRFDRQVPLSALQSVLMPAGAALLVSRGLGLEAVASWYAILQAAACAVFVAVLWAALRPAREFPSGKGLDFKSYAAFSLHSWLVPVASVVNSQLDKVFIVRAVSLTDLTLYAVPSGLLQRLQMLPATIATVLLPTTSAVQGPDARERLVRMYLKSTRFLLWITLPILVLLFSLMPQFLALWLGPEFVGRSVWPARLLVVAQALGAINFIPNIVSVSRDRPEYYSAMAWAQAALNVLAWWWLIPRHQILGAAAGACLSQAAVTAANLALVHGRLLSLSWADYGRGALLRPGLAAAALLAAVFPLHHLAQSWPALLALGAAGGLVYAAVLWPSLHAEDREFLRGLAKAA